MTDSTAPVSAKDLRMTIPHRELAEAKRRDRQKVQHDKGLPAFTGSFPTEHVTGEERPLIQKLEMYSVNNCKIEPLVSSFSSDLCSNSGRAIKNRPPCWPETLQGKARELSDRFLAVAKPQGFRKQATMINFPGGMPGDVGFLLNWEPDRPV